LNSVNNRTNYKPTGKYLDIHGRLETPHPNLNLNTTKGRSYTDNLFKGEYKKRNSKTLSRKKEKNFSRESGQHFPLSCVGFKD
jgi:hypothetical protein